MDKIRIGVVGTGGIFNGSHMKHYSSCEDCAITAICDIDKGRLNKTGDKLGIPQEYRYTDYRALLKCGVIDAVDVATSNDVHVEIAIAALDAGFPVSVEKPIGINFKESFALMEKSKETGLPVFVCFSWRYFAYPRYMKYLIDQGTVGELHHIYIKSIKDSGLWEGRRLEWRFREERAGSGVLCDLGSHMFDTIRFFGQEIESVYCDRGIIVKERQLPDSEEWGKVTTDDWSNAVCRLESGIGATVTLSRTCRAEKDTIEFYVSGSKGALRLLAENRVQTLTLCAGEDLETNTFRPLELPEEFTKGNQSRSFLDLLKGYKDPYTATIFDGIKSQAAVDAAKYSSECGRAVTLKEMFE